MIKIGDLVRGHYFHRKIGVVVEINPDADEGVEALVHFMDGTKCWEPLACIRKAIK